jgi:PAS domain S-box-containing protein
MVISLESANIKPEQLLKIILDHTSDLIVILNEKLEIEIINEKVHKKLTGFTNADLIGKPTLDLIHPKDHKKLNKGLKRLFESGYNEGEVRFRHKNGNYIKLKIKGQIFNDNLGKKRIILMGKEIESAPHKSEDRFREMIDNLSEIRFWKLLQPKKALVAYQESQEMLKIIMDNIPQYIAWKDKNLIYLGCNNNFLKLTGFKDEKDIIGKIDVDLDWEEEYAIFLRENDTRILKSNIPEYHKIELWINEEGKQVWFDTNRIPLHDSKGNVVGILITFEDITDRKLSEEILKESEEKYSTIFNSSPNYIYLTNCEGNILDCNQAMLNGSGRSLEEFKGKNFLNFYAGDNITELLKIFDILRKGKEIRGLEVHAKDIHGEINTFEIDSVPLKEDGKVVKILSFARNVTDRKQAEKRLKESEEKYRHLFESSPYAIWLVNLKGKIIDCNSTMDKLLSKYTKNDLIGKKYTEVLSMFDNPDYFIPIFRQKFKKLLKGEKLEPMEFQMFRADGIKVWIELLVSKVILEEENLFHIIIMDITEKKKAELKIKQSEEELRLLNKELERKVIERTKELVASEEKLRQQNIELKKLDDIKNDFITMAAHELKTPLISISGYTDYILTKHKDDLNNLNPEINEDLIIVKRNINRLRNLMDQLLDVMKIESKKMEIHKKPTNVSNIINNCIDELSYLFKEKNHELKLNIDKEIILNVDSERFFEILSNLLSNATKFTPKNGKIEILACQKDENTYLFNIKDNGIGLNPEELRKIFKKFGMIRQINDENYIRGTGLGLYISKGFVEAHGGKIWASSLGYDKGTTFSFTIPT